MAFELTKRCGLIIYVTNLRQVRQLRRYGNVEYVSRKMRYVLLYVDADKLNEKQGKIEQLNFVIKTELAIRPDLNPNLAVESEDRGFSLDVDTNNDIIEGVTE